MKEPSDYTIKSPPSIQHAECARPRRGPLYWDWRCLNCDRPVSAHRSRLRRIVFDNSVWGFWRRHNDGDDRG